MSTKALLIILPLPEDTLNNSTIEGLESSAHYELLSQLGQEKTARASFLGFIDGRTPSLVYVVKNRAGYGGLQSFSVLEDHIIQTYKKKPEEEKTYGTYY